MKYLLAGAAVAPLALTLSAGQSQAQETVAAAAAADAPVEVVIFGHRAAEREALDQQHSSQVKKEVVTANDAGKLPDQNVGEAVQRMPGVTVDDDQGEGRYVVIRGLDPALAAVRINGQDAAAPETDTREVKVDTIPTGLIGSIEVMKNQTAEYDANAIAGAVNVKTLSAFDRRKPFLTARYSAGYIELNDKTSYDTDISAGTRFGPNKEFGIVAALNASRRPQASDNFQGTDAWKTTDAGIAVPDDWRLRDYYVIRNRQGAALNFDYKPSDDVHLYARTLFSHFTDMEQREEFRVNIDDALEDATATTGTFTAGKAVNRNAKYRFEDEHIGTVNLGGEFSLGTGKLEIDATHSTADKDDDPRYNFSYDGPKGLEVAYDLSDPLFMITPPAAAYDASKYKSKEAELEADHYRETLNQFSADYSLPTSLFGDTTFKMGFKYSDRHKKSDVQYRLYEVKGLVLSDFLSYDATPLYDGRYPFGPTVDFIKSLDAAKAQGLLDLSVEDSIADDLGGDYDVSEKVTAAYAQATIHNGNLTLTPGLRVEQTDASYKAIQFDTDDITTEAELDAANVFNSFGKKSYTDLFPSLVGRYDFNENSLVRFAATTSIGRPNYVDLAPRIAINHDEDDVEMEIGNPDLNPLTSVNLDAGLEHYFGKKGVISVSAFYKDIDHPIFVTEREADNETINGTVYDGVKITQSRNLNSAKVSGVEFNFVMQFDSLPAPFDGLGASLNVTEQSSSTDGAEGRDKVRLIYTSDTTGTAELTYEKYNWTARIAYSYRSKFLDTLGETPEEDIYTAGRGKVDLKVGYALNDTWQLFVEGKNLNEAVWRRFQKNEHQIVENEFYGRTWAVGVAAKF